MRRTLSQALDEFLSYERPRNVYCWARKPVADSDTDAWEVSIGGGSEDDSEEMMKLARIFAAGWMQAREALERAPEGAEKPSTIPTG